jgi:hypothetical protein
MMEKSRFNKIDVKGGAILLLVFFLVNVSLGNYKRLNYVPPNGFVPDSLVAIKIAEAVLFPIYGEEKIKKQKPYRVILIGDSIWAVNGTFPVLPNNQIVRGGTFEIKIQKSDARVIEVYHGR